MLDFLVLFILNAAGMILELVASRFLSPYFGSSNFVWTAIIGIILLAGSLGNLIGGKIASYKNDRVIVGGLLLFATVFLALTPVIGTPILETIHQMDSNVQSASVVSSMLFFLIPATILGIITPIIMKERISENRDKGKESGRITAIIAIGSLVGTFLGGFWLIPLLGTKVIFEFLAIIVLISAVMFCFRFDGRKMMFMYYISCFFVLVLTVGIFIFVVDTDDDFEKTGRKSIDTEYGRIIIENGDYLGDEVRFYKQSGAFSSATFLEDDKKFELVFKYLNKYDEMFKFLDARSTLMIGGAAYQYPKYYISHFLDKKMDVVEIDPMSTKIAKDYFFLDDLINEYDSDGERLRLYNEDGRVFLMQSDVHYDAILDDAFSGEVPVGTLATVEAARIIKDSLVDGGVYISNVLGSVSGDKGRFLRSEIKTLAQVFDNVYVIPVYEHAELDDYTNWMVIATDNESYVPEDLVTYTLVDDDLVLTDDYNPVDDLVSTSYFD